MTAGQQDQTVLKVGAIFFVTAASLLGAVPPVLRFGGSADNPSPGAYILRAFTAGVLMALAFVHVIADGQERLDGLAGDFPIAQVLVMSGIVIMFLTERASMEYLSASSAAPAPMEHLSNDPVTSLRRQSLEEGLLTDCAEQEISRGAECDDGDACCADECGGEDRSHQGHLHDYGRSSRAPAVDGREFADGKHEHVHDHGHVHCRRATQHAPGMVEGGGTPVLCTEHTHVHAHHKGHVMLGMLELGIIVHSIIIGVAFGASRYRTKTAVGYVVALSFHQLFEGIGLGTCISTCMQQVSLPASLALPAFSPSRPRLPPAGVKFFSFPPFVSTCFRFLRQRLFLSIQESSARCV